MKNNSLIGLGNECYWNRESNSLFVEGFDVRLSISQKKLLKFLIQNINKPVQNLDIFYEIHDSLDKEFNEKSVRNLIASLRRVAPTLNLKNIYGGYYILKSEDIGEDIKFKESLFEILEQSKNAIVITNPNKFDNPIIYVNSAFCELFGYSYEEAVGKNCRFLTNDDTNQDGLAMIREAIKDKKAIEVNIRDYTKDGKLIYDDITISPIFDKQKAKLIYFLGIHKDVTSLQQILQKIQGAD